MRSLLALAAAVSLAAVACRVDVHAAVGHPQPAPPDASFPWKTTIDREHPLVGKIYDTGGRRFVSRDEALARAAAASIVMLGEKHDNVDHHALQAQAIEAIVARGRKPAVAFEMLDSDEQAIVTAASIEHPNDADAIGQAVRWDKKGWPPWPEYAPIFRAATSHALPIVAANLPLGEVRSIARGGIDAIAPEEAQRLGLDRAPPPEIERDMEGEIRDVHCGHLPEHAIPTMVLAQRARDAEMAIITLRVRQPNGAVLIAGDGHVRRDRGVPAQLAERGVAPADIVTIAFVEVAPELKDPAAYASRWHADALPFDLVWFTPRASDDDPCAAFHGKAKR